MMPEEVRVHERTDEMRRLRALLHEDRSGLSICSISGAGGVGKSHLLQHTLESVDLRELGWLQLRVDASREENRRDLFAAIESLCPQALPHPADRLDYFPRIRALAKAHRELVDAVQAEMRSASVDPGIRDATLGLLRLGQLTNRVFPATKKALNLDALPSDPAELDRVMEEVQRGARSIRALADESFLAKLFPRRARQRIKANLYGAIADDLRTDLSAMLAGYEARDSLKPTHPRIPNLRRLLLIFDDFEALAPVVEDLLISALIPRLDGAKFSTLIVILGRDDLAAMGESWEQHCKQYRRERIEVLPFDRDDAIKLLAASGIEQGRAASIYKETGGFPFLISLIVEEASSGSGWSALTLRKFFDRTTRWMSDIQKRWFVGVCYLDQVNEDTLAIMFADENAAMIHDWFERESSIRDPWSSDFVVRPIIREKVLLYQSVRAPSRHRAMLEKGTLACGSASHEHLSDC